MGDRCTGNCCRSFVLQGIGQTPEEMALYLRHRAMDGGYIADMIIPLHAIEPGALLPNGEAADAVPPGGGWVFTCRHFDTVANNCTAYETRPAMCREFPYGKPCEHKECTWDVGREGLWPPPKVHYRTFGTTHLAVLSADGKSQKHWGPSKLDADCCVAG